MKDIAFIAAQAIWGFPQTALGCAVCLAHRRRPHFRYQGAIVTSWDNAKGMSLGPFIFLNGPHSAADAAIFEEMVDTDLLAHEYGHCVQSLILGPLYLPLVGIPSVLWSNVPRFERYRRKKQVSYYDFLPERSATRLGNRVLKN
jgi:hypothetical protein